MGVGYQGKTLKQMLEERNESAARTGRCFGLERLPINDEDPITLTRFHWRITSSCVAARETAKWVAGSPVMRAWGECLWLVARPEGDVIAASLGLMGHVACTPEVIRNIIRQGFEDRPGIKEGDIYFCADSLYGNPHNTDVQTIVPIFYKGQLVAWAVGVIHIGEAGPALGIGSAAPLSPNSFTDGFLFPPMRIGENFETYPWWETIWRRKTRAGAINVLDEKARIVGCLMIREKVLAMIDEYGLDYFNEATKEIFERERLTLERHIKRETIPGRYRQCSFRPFYQKGLVPSIPEANSNILDQQPIEMRILPSGRIQADVEGTSSAWWHSANSLNPESALLGLFFWWMSSVMRESGGLNSSLTYQMDWIVPPGTRLNAAAFSPFAGQQSAPADHGRIGSGMTNMYTRARLGRGIIEEAIAKQTTGWVSGFGGRFQNGTQWGMTDFTGGAFDGRAAGPYQDGIEFAGATANPQGDWQEVEELEMYFPPMVTLTKGLVRDLTTPGKYRGPMNSHIVYLIYHPGKATTVNTICPPNAVFGDVASGVSGSHQALGCYSILFHNTNMMELMAKGEGYPADLREIWQWKQEGKLKVGSISVDPGDRPTTSTTEGDLFVCLGLGEAAWGDELVRDPLLVESDLEKGFVSPEAARELFAVEVKEVGGRWVHDPQATGELRKKKLAERVKKAVPCRDWWNQERNALRDKRFTSPLVSNLYCDAFQRSSKWREEFIDFWQLGQDYQLEVQPV